VLVIVVTNWTSNKNSRTTWFPLQWFRQSSCTKIATSTPMDITLERCSWKRVGWGCV